MTTKADGEYGDITELASAVMPILTLLAFVALNVRVE